MHIDVCTCRIIDHSPSWITAMRNDDVAAAERSREMEIDWRQLRAIDENYSKFQQIGCFKTWSF